MVRVDFGAVLVGPLDNGRNVSFESFFCLAFLTVHGIPENNIRHLLANIDRLTSSPRITESKFQCVV